MAWHVLFGGRCQLDIFQYILGRSLTSRSLLNGLTCFIRRQMSTPLSQKCRPLDMLRGEFFLPFYLHSFFLPFYLHRTDTAWSPTQRLIRLDIFLGRSLTARHIYYSTAWHLLWADSQFNGLFGSMGRSPAQWLTQLTLFSRTRRLAAVFNGIRNVYNKITTAYKQINPNLLTSTMPKSYERKKSPLPIKCPKPSYVGEYPSFI